MDDACLVLTTLGVDIYSCIDKVKLLQDVAVKTPVHLAYSLYSSSFDQNYLSFLLALRHWQVMHSVEKFSFQSHWLARRCSGQIVVDTDLKNSA